MNLFNIEVNSYQKYQNMFGLIALTIGFLILGIDGQEGDITDQGGEGVPQEQVVTSAILTIEGDRPENCKTARFDAHLYPNPCKKYNEECKSDNPMDCDGERLKNQHQKNCDGLQETNQDLFSKFCEPGGLDA